MDYPSDPAVRLHNGKFTDGDPTQGIPASIDTAAHNNALTDEVLNVIRAFNIEPDEDDHSQLLTALTAMASQIELAALKRAYPIGQIFWNYSDSRNPATILGFGSWVAVFQGRVPVGVNASNPAQTFVGSDSKYVTVPRDGWGSVTSSEGGSDGLQPYTEDGVLITGSGNREINEKLESLAQASYNRSVPVDVRQAGQTAYAWRRTA